jgi:hypothetical protein
MQKDNRRITLVTCPEGRQPDRVWNFTSVASSRLIAVGSFAVLPYALEDSMSEQAHDVERLVIDRTATPSQYLELLAALPEKFVGDVLYIQDDGSAFLSAAGRGSGRMLYKLGANDLRFYLEMHDLLMPAMARTA